MRAGPGDQPHFAPDARSWLNVWCRSAGARKARADHSVTAAAGGRRCCRCGRGFLETWSGATAYSSLASSMRAPSRRTLVASVGRCRIRKSVVGSRGRDVPRVSRCDLRPVLLGHVGAHVFAGSSQQPAEAGTLRPQSVGGLAHCCLDPALFSCAKVVLSMAAIAGRFMAPTRARPTSDILAQP